MVTPRSGCRRRPVTRRRCVRERLARHCGLVLTRHDPESVGGSRDRGDAESGLHRRLPAGGQDPRASRGRPHLGTEDYPDGGESILVGRGGVGTDVGAGELHHDRGARHGTPGPVGHREDERLGQGLTGPPVLAITLNDGDVRGLAFAGSTRSSPQAASRERRRTPERRVVHGSQGSARLHAGERSYVTAVGKLIQDNWLQNGNWGREIEPGVRSTPHPRGREGPPRQGTSIVTVTVALSPVVLGVISKRVGADKSQVRRVDEPTVGAERCDPFDTSASRTAVSPSRRHRCHCRARGALSIRGRPSGAASIPGGHRRALTSCGAVVRPALEVHRHCKWR
jgi:hypothetical protein